MTRKSHAKPAARKSHAKPAPRKSGGPRVPVKKLTAWLTKCGAHRLQEWWVGDARARGALARHCAGWRIGQRLRLIRLEVRDDDGGPADFQLPTDHALDVTYCRVSAKARKRFGGGDGESQDVAKGVYSGDGDESAGAGAGGVEAASCAPPDLLDAHAGLVHKKQMRHAFRFSRALVKVTAERVDNDDATAAGKAGPTGSVVIRALVYGRPGLPAGARCRLAPPSATERVFHPPRVILRHRLFNSLYFGQPGEAASLFDEPPLQLDVSFLARPADANRVVSTAGTNTRGERVVMSLMEGGLPPGTLLPRGASPMFVLQGFNYTKMEYFAAEKTLLQLAQSTNEVMQQMARQYDGHLATPLAGEHQ